MCLHCTTSLWLNKSHNFRLISENKIILMKYHFPMFVTNKTMKQNWLSHVNNAILNSNLHWFIFSILCFYLEYIDKKRFPYKQNYKNLHSFKILTSPKPNTPTGLYKKMKTKHDGYHLGTVYRKASKVSVIF